MTDTNLQPSLDEESPQSRSTWRRAIVYFLWGENFLLEAYRSAESAAQLNIDRVLITDQKTVDLLRSSPPFELVKTCQISEDNQITKTTLHDHLPSKYNSFLFLDTDTIVLGDIQFGFEMAERWGIAMVPAPSYGLDTHWGFEDDFGSTVMAAVGMPCEAQVQYNSGVIFFVRRPDVDQVFRQSKKLAFELTQSTRYKRVDQPFFSLSMEMAQFNPYTLSPNYNFRALIGEHVSGKVRIWHSRHPVPPDLNQYKFNWPPRHYIDGIRIETRTIRLIARFLRLLRRFLPARR